MKAYTDIEQSKKLAEILPIESADMCWCNNSIKGVNYTDEFSANLYTVKEMKELFDTSLNGWDKYWELIPCWSLSALLSVLPKEVRLVGTPKNHYWYCECLDVNNNWYIGFTSSNNPVDACVEYIKIAWTKLIVIMENYEKKYKNAPEWARQVMNGETGFIRKDVENIFPELAESEDEKIRKEILDYIVKATGCKRWIAWLEKHGQTFTKKDVDDAYLKGVCDAKSEIEKQGKNHCMIQWKGDNLKEVIDFTGKDRNFEKWFKSFEEYEKYVQEHDGIFKLFNADGSHYEVPVGAWIVKTPDGYNVASKAVFKQKFVDTPKFKVEQTTAWSEDDKDLMYDTLSNLTELKDRYGEGYGNVGKCIEWLKSLKGRVQPQKQWKPSEEQMDALAESLSLAKNCGEESAFDLRTLYEQLKKL